MLTLLWKELPLSLIIHINGTIVIGDQHNTKLSHTGIAKAVESEFDWIVKIINGQRKQNAKEEECKDVKCNICHCSCPGKSKAAV